MAHTAECKNTELIKSQREKNVDGDKMLKRITSTENIVV